NAILAGLLAYLGDRLGVPLYYAAILVFGGRLFQNLAVIRRLLIDKILAKKDNSIAKK
ncbi:MAG TPA: small basic family protein, partial [Clostridiales bacterium]|nr:small basic family protein [Clostridiales bacterium]